MFILVQESEYERNRVLLNKMYQLRKAIFFDELQWDVSVDEAGERDRYDDLGPAYLIWCDEDRETLYGSLRLLPTTGPTLLNDVFRRTYSPDLDLCHPSIWEGTRMCIDADAIAADMPQTGARSGMVHMLVALAECALAKGISTLVSNYEPHMKRIYQQAGAPLSEIGRADGFGRRPVCCGLFGVDQKVIGVMRDKTGLHGLYSDGPRRSLADTPSMFEFALENEKLRASSRV